MLIGLSGTEINLVRVPTSSPEYSMRYFCTMLTIIMYSSSLANLCPIQALGGRENLALGGKLTLTLIHGQKEY